MTDVVGFDCEHERDDPMARQMVADLCHAYPGHAWFVLVKGGVVQVKNMDFHPDWGMVLHYSQIKGDANERKRLLLRNAGEFLERANLKRGAKTDAPLLGVEGIPEVDMLKARLSQ